MLDDLEEFKLMTGEPADSVEFKHEQWDKYIEIEPMDSHESFSIMESFTNDLNNNKLKCN